MEIPKEVKSLYSILNDKQIEYIRSKYYYSILEPLEKWKLKFENNLISIDEVKGLENNTKEEAVIIARSIKKMNI